MMWEIGPCRVGSASCGWLMLALAYQLTWLGRLLSGSPGLLRQCLCCGLELGECSCERTW